MSFSEKGEGRRNFAPRNICLPRVETHHVSQLRHRKKKEKTKIMINQLRISSGDGMQTFSVFYSFSTHIPQSLSGRHGMLIIACISILSLLR